MHTAAMTTKQLEFEDPEDPQIYLKNNADWLNDRYPAYSYRQRKSVGDKHEQRVRKEFERRGWEVNNWGQGLLGPATVAALKFSPNGMKWAPDFFVARGNETVFVDAKGSTQPVSKFRDSYFVERSAIDAHIKLFASMDVSVFYVFDDLKIINAIDAKRHGRLRKGLLRGSGTPCYSIPTQACRSLDDVFGGTAQERGAA